MLTAINDAATAQDDAFTVAENAILNGGASVFTDNGSGADSDPDGRCLSVHRGERCGGKRRRTDHAGVGRDAHAQCRRHLHLQPERRVQCIAGGGLRRVQHHRDRHLHLHPDRRRYRDRHHHHHRRRQRRHLRGTAGNDALTGGIGNDSYFVENAGDAITETAGQGTLDRVYASVSYVLAAGDDIETDVDHQLARHRRDQSHRQRARQHHLRQCRRSTRSTAAAATTCWSGFAGDDTLNGGGGDDQLYGGAGQNDMAGGTGNDWYIVDSLTDVIIEAAGEGTLDRVFTT